MRNFKDAYKSAVNELPKFHMEAGLVQDELHHRKMEKLKRHKHMMSMAMTASFFLVFGISTVAAMNYHQSVIKMQDGGYTITGGRQITGQEAGLEGTAECSPADMNQNSQSSGGGGVAAAAETGGSPLSVFPETDGGGSNLKQARSNSIEELEIVESESQTFVTYDSLEAFQEAANVLICFPDISWLGEDVDVEAMVSEDMKSVDLVITAGEKMLRMSQFDHRDSISYGSSSIYSAEVTNERTITNSQGLGFTVFDTVRDGSLEGVHGVISINGIDIELGFYGCEAETAETAMKQMDLSIYFNE